MELYDLQLTVEELNDSGDYRYIAVSPDLPNLMVVGDTVEEVLSLAPQVAAALIASMKAASDTSTLSSQMI
jgi:predicted RNase H-like HicB family nuclease